MTGESVIIATVGRRVGIWVEMVTDGVAPEVGARDLNVGLFEELKSR